MRRSLKYFIPILVFITALFLIAIEAWIHNTIQYDSMLQKASVDAKVIGNRLASRITLESKKRGIDRQMMISLVAPYMADTIDLVEIYDQKANRKFTHHVVSSYSRQVPVDLAIVKKVSQEQFSHIAIKKEAEYITGYFPIDLPVEAGKVLSRHKGVIYLVFDLSDAYAATKEFILYNTMMNVSIVLIMLVVFSALSYFFVFRRLDVLHEATKRVASGDMSILVHNCGNDELTDVINTFNDMTLQINAYIHQMEEQVEKAVEQRSEQSKMLIHQSRLASMGEMIGNIAHQWRQPLNALGLIIQKMDILSKRDKLTADVVQINTKKSLELIHTMSTTIDDFRGFFRPDKQKKSFNLKSLMQEVYKLLESSLEHENITLELDIPPFCEIYGYRNEFSQVIVNLINNSKDAFRETSIQNARILISAVENEQSVTIMVADNAGGIPLSVMSRIFEPYYTTKEEGKGTGIGLYMSKMIVEDNMDGQLSVANAHNGAMFKIRFNKGEGWS